MAVKKTKRTDLDNVIDRGFRRMAELNEQLWLKRIRRFNSASSVLPEVDEEIYLNLVDEVYLKWMQKLNRASSVLPEGVYLRWMSIFT